MIINTMNDFNEYRYDNCIARGICSSNPKTTALQEVIFLYLKHIAYYLLKLDDSYSCYSNIKRLIIFSISVMVSNTELFESDFNFLQTSLAKELSKIILKYKNICKKKKVVPILLEPALNFKNKANTVDFIRFGESEYNKKNDTISIELRNLYKILFLVIKSLCINIINASNYAIDSEEDYRQIIVLLNLLISTGNTEDELKTQINLLAQRDFKLMKEIREAQIKKYGEQEQTEVSYSTQKGKAILVVGSDIYELEKILKNFKEYDIYTHDEMLIAHTFPAFKEHKNLKGQYGIGFENCLIDFSTFPGPIILTRNSLYNVQNLYRGRLFTTDIAHSKGVVRINNDDFSELKKVLEESRGFKTGKICEPETVGFNYNKVLAEVTDKIKTGDFSKIVILGNPEGYINLEEYFKNFLEHISQDILVLSMFCCEQKQNVVCVNALYDNYALSYFAHKIAEELKRTVNVFIPICKKHTITDLICLSSNKNINIFWNLDCCRQINPNVINMLADILKINIISTPKNDLKKLI